MPINNVKEQILCKEPPCCNDLEERKNPGGKELNEIKQLTGSQEAVAAGMPVSWHTTGTGPSLRDCRTGLLPRSKGRGVDSDTGSIILAAGIQILLFWFFLKAAI
jgi:hypothetical protein